MCMIPDITDDGETKAESLARTTPDEASTTYHLILNIRQTALNGKNKMLGLFFDKHKGKTSIPGGFVPTAEVASTPGGGGGRYIISF